jgi:hypothetical protein
MTQSEALYNILTEYGTHMKLGNGNGKVVCAFLTHAKRAYWGVEV